MKIITWLEKVWDWLVVSSSNPEKVSLTVKGFFGTLIVTIMWIVNSAHVQVPGLNDALNGIVDQVLLLIQYGLGIISSLSFIIGAVRKIVNTVVTLWQSIFQ